MARKSMATREDLEYMLVDERADPRPLPYSLLEGITNDFHEEIGSGASALVYKGYIGDRMVAVKKMSVVTTQIEQFGQEIEILMRVKHKNVVQFLGYCSDAQEFFKPNQKVRKSKRQERLSKAQERLLCFEYLPATLYDYTDDEYHGLTWRQCYEIIVGVCQGLHRLHEDNIIHGDLKPKNILMDDNKLPKLADFGLAKCLDEVQPQDSTEDKHKINFSCGYIAPEVLNRHAKSKKSDLYSFGVVIMGIVKGRLEDIGNSQTHAELKQIQKCTQIGSECTDVDPTNRPDTKQILERLGVKTGDTQETQEGLHAKPTVLVFVFDSQPSGKLIPCPLQLTNDTDQHMAFKLSTTQSVDWSEHFMGRLPLYGIVPARSTYTIILTVSERKLPTKRICELILQSCTSRNYHITKFKDKKECEEYFEDYKAATTLHEVKLNAFLSEAWRPTLSEPRVRILSVEQQPYTLYSVDAHPTNPWIITGHDFGHVRIWNHETKILLNSFKVSQGRVYSVKFIARKHWFICASEEGLIHVYSYESKMQKITSFKAHDGLMSLAVHPTKPYVLSWPCSGHHQKKLWDWSEKEWKCTQTFDKEMLAGNFLCHVAFDPKDENRFASTWKNTLKVWSLDSRKPRYTLLVNFNQVNFLEFFTRADGQYLITNSHDMTAKIWDMQTRKYVPNKSQTSVLPVASVFSHPNLPILLTRSTHGTCHLWSSKDFRLEGVLEYGSGGDVRGITCFMGSKRSNARSLYVIGQESTITILEIANGKYHKDSVESSEPQKKYSETPSRGSTKVNLQEITQGSNRLLHIRPMKLHFLFQDHKVNLCSLHLTNYNSERVAFRLSVDERWKDHPFDRMPLGGIVPSRSTYTLVVITRELPKLEQPSFNLILQSSISGDRFKYTFKDQAECYAFFEEAKEKNEVDDLPLEAVLSFQGLAMSEDGSTREDLIKPSVNIWGLFHPAKALCSLDADPTESWILTGHRQGNISLWKCGTQRMMSSVIVCEETRVPCNRLDTRLDVYSIKFITRKRWFVAGTYDGFIHVYNYEPRIDHVHKVKVHSYSGSIESGIYLSRALCIHPTESYVLSTFEGMKLLDWEDDWKCIQTFETKHYDSVRQVAFNPEDTNTFASASSDHTIKLWRLDSSTPEQTLRGHSDKVNCLEFFKCAGQQYLISGSQDCTARIWNLKERMCVQTQDVFMSPVISVISLPDASYLTTGSEDGTIHLWSYSLRDPCRLQLMRIFNIACNGPVQSLCFMGSKRVVIQQEGEISIMDMVTISETSESDLPDVLIHVEPLELRFPLLQVVSIPLKISNVTSHHVALSLLSKSHKALYSLCLPIVYLPPNSTLEFLVVRFAYNVVGSDLMHKELVSIRGIIMAKGLKITDITLDMFEPNRGRNVHEVKLDVVYVATEIISKVSLPWTLDVHPTEPRLLTTQGDYHVHIWNYEGRKTKSIAIKGREVTSAKFIARKQWIVAGCSTGLIYMYSYNPIKKIEVLQHHSASVNSLAVHTTRPYVLSASQDGKIFMWNYENEWDFRTIVDGNDRKLMKAVHAKFLSVEQVAFPMETDMFASAQDKTVKIWDLRKSDPIYKHMGSSVDPEHILFGHTDLVVCLDYFSLGGKLHLITGSQDNTAKIWDCETNKCVQTLRHMDVVKIACFHPDLQILITGSGDGSVILWDSKTFRLSRTLKLGLGEIYAVASLKGSTRIAIANEKGLALVEIGLEDKKDDNVTIMGSSKDKGRMIEERVIQNA